MRISVNLATRPFVELRPLLAKLRLAAAALVLLLVALAFGDHVLNQRAREANAQMDALKARTAAVNEQRARNEARMRQPENRGVLEQSTFLNGVFARKSFSWTATMMDLERVLPVGVQVTSIEPIITKEGDVNIRLRVSGDRDRTLQLVRNLEGSSRFLHARLVGETALTGERAKALGVNNGATVQGGATLQPVSGMAALGPVTGVEFDILSGYNPLPAAKDEAFHRRPAPVTSSEDVTPADTAGGAR